MLGFLLGSAAFLAYAAAASLDDVQYPVAELGSCADADACRAYCDESANAEACLRFAESRGLFSAREAEQVREAMQKTGPGGCTGVEACRAYCDDSSHSGECLDFAEREGLIKPEELERARALLNEGGPGGCKSESECRTYCNDPAHAEECVDSAVKLGMLDPEEAEKIKKMASREGPGGCKSEGDCRAYCDGESRQEECISFAVENGMMSAEEAERARKMISQEGPGGCRGRQCQTYCENPDNAEACFEFAKKEGLLPAEELLRAEKFMNASRQGGPGGCRAQQCRDYCEDESHRDECFEFAKKHGLISPEDEERTEMGRRLDAKVKESGGPGGCKSGEECRTYCGDPGRTEECIAFGSAHAGLSPDEARKMLKEFSERKFMGPPSGPGPVPPGRFGPDKFGPPPEVLAEMRRFESEAGRRFEEFRQLEMQFRASGPNGASLFGAPPAGGQPPEGMPAGDAGSVVPKLLGPGGCASPQECISYCQAHREECFSPASPPDQERQPLDDEHAAGFEGRPERAPGAPEEFLMIAPRLRSDLLREFRPDERPEGFPGNRFPDNGASGEMRMEGRPGEALPEDRGEFERQYHQPTDGARPPSWEGMGPLEGTPGIFSPLHNESGAPARPDIGPNEGTYRPPTESNPSPAPLPAPTTEFRSFSAPTESNPSPAPLPAPAGEMTAPSGGTYSAPPMESNPSPAPLPAPTFESAPAPLPSPEPAPAPASEPPPPTSVLDFWMNAAGLLLGINGY